MVNVPVGPGRGTRQKRRRLAGTKIVGGPGTRSRSRSLGAVVPAACSQPTRIQFLHCDGLAQWAIGTIFSCTRVLVLGLRSLSGISEESGCGPCGAFRRACAGIYANCYSTTMMLCASESCLHDRQRA